MEAFFLDFEQYIHKAVRLHRVDHFFTRTQPQFSIDDIYQGSEYRYSLWLGREDTHYPPIIIADRDNYVHDGREQYSLQIVRDYDTIGRYIDDLPTKLKHKIVDILNEHGSNLGNKLEEINLSQELIRSYIFTEPIPSLKDTTAIEKIGDDWTAFTYELTGWNAPAKDERLRLVQKPHLLRGLIMRLNPHALICTNAGTAKTTFYKKVGIVVDRATKSSMTGFAKNPEEVFTSTMHHNELSYCIDQIESNYWNILNQAFNLLEDGHARVDVGSTKVHVDGNFSLSLLANPTESTTDPTKDFSLILNHLSKNPALGRRFGPIVYGTDYKVVPPGRDADLKDWDKALTFFRAVEDYTRPKLKEIIADPAIWDWMAETIPTYQHTIDELTAEVPDDQVRNFLREHGKAGQHRVKAAALYSSLVDNLNHIALDAIDVNELITDAHQRLGDFVALNITSIENIVKGYTKIRANMVKVWFGSLVKYQKYIVSACELYRRQKPVTPTVSLNDVGKAWKLDDKYHQTPEYLSKHIDTLKRHLNAQTKLNNGCKEHLKLSIYPKDGTFYVHYSDMEPRPEIEPIGTLDFSIISTFLQQPETERHDNVVESEHRRNVENVEKRNVNEDIHLICDYLATKTEAIRADIIAVELGLTKNETLRLLAITDKDGTTYQPRPGTWRLA